MIKQVICVRGDLKVRKGKLIAQGCHASIAFLTRRLEKSKNIDLSEAEEQWMKESFAKICLKVKDEDELVEIYNKAKEAGLEVHLITDSGRTEFHGVPTKTCLAIGPDHSEKIDLITGNLDLL